MVLYVLIIFFVVSPYFPATENPHWFFRTADFVRLQSLMVQLVLLLFLIYFEDQFTVFTWILMTALVLSMIYQLLKVVPYSSIYPRKSVEKTGDGHVSIFAG